jgi:prevent-host-death family protein
MTVSIAEAKNRLPELIRAVEGGERVVITRHGKPVAQLAPAPGPATVPFGAMRSEFGMKEGWERPLSDQEADEFWDGKW